MKLRLITEAGDLRGRYVIIRSSCNVPLENDGVRNSFRLKRALPTLEYLKQAGAKTIIISHIGREKHDSLHPVFGALSAMFGGLKWGGVITDPTFREISNSLAEGETVLCENLRQDEREETNDESLVNLLASFGEIYVNDAFAEAHREHASTYGLAKALPAYAGLTLNEEVEQLSKVMTPEQPSLFLLGGAKFETKMPLVEKYLTEYSQVFIGGALSNDILKARGLEVGLSLVSEVSLQDSPFLWHKNILVPVDVVVDGPRGVSTKLVSEVLPDEKIFDCGPKTTEMLSSYIEGAKTILWNGPFGNYEAGYYEGTEKTAKMVADSKAFSVIGGGDSVAAIEKLGLNDKFGFVSVGGGSMLTLLENGSTPVLDLLKK